MTLLAIDEWFMGEGVCDSASIRVIRAAIAEPLDWCVCGHGRLRHAHLGVSIGGCEIEGCKCGQFDAMEARR